MNFSSISSFPGVSNSHFILISWDSATVWEVETVREDKNALFPILLDQESPFKNVVQIHMYLDHNLDQNFMRR